MDNSLFSGPSGSPESFYESLRNGHHEIDARIRVFVDHMWGVYQPYADRNFATELRRDFHARFWEMYLTYILLSHGYRIHCHKPGPDILVNSESSRIWIEAVAPSQGSDGSKDHVPDMVTDRIEVQHYPEREIILRYRAAIYEKFHNKYLHYVETGIVEKSDPFIIAINSAKMRFAMPGLTPPDIVRAVFPIGHLQVHIDCSTLEITGMHHQYRPEIRKNSGSPVSTEVFLIEEYTPITGIMFSHCSAANCLHPRGEEFMFIHNPIAKNPIPRGFFAFGVEYTAVMKGDGYELEEINHGGTKMDPDNSGIDRH